MSQDEPMPTRVRPPSRPLNRRSVGPGTLSAINPNSSSNITQNIEINTQNDLNFAKPLPITPINTPIEKKPLPERPQVPIRPERSDSRPPLPEKPTHTPPIPNSTPNSTPILHSKPPEKPPPVPFARPSLVEKPSSLPALPDKLPPKASGNVIEKPPLPGKPSVSERPPLPDKPNNNHVERSERERPPNISLLNPSNSEKNPSLSCSFFLSYI